MLTPSNMENLIGKSLEILGSGLDNDELLDAWTEVFNMLVVQLRLEYVVSDVLDHVFPLFTYQKPLSCRVRATRMILAIVKRKLP